MRLTESWSLVLSKLSCMGEAVGLWGGAGTLWMETPGPTLRTRVANFDYFTLKSYPPNWPEEEYEFTLE